jgi:hypothetical protein
MLSACQILWVGLLAGILLRILIMPVGDMGIKWQVTRFAQPHIHMYMFCPYVISTLYRLLEEYK